MARKTGLRYRILYGDKGKPPVFGVRLNIPGKSVRRNLDIKIADFSHHILTVIVIGVGALFALPSIYRPGAEIIVMILAVAAGIAVITYACLARTSLRDLRKHHLGWYCEAVIGQELERCRAYRYSVFHDIAYESGGKRFNVDHLLIGPAGVIVVETKGRTKPKKGKTEVEISNGRLVFSGRASEERPINQINALAATVKEDLEKVMRASGLSALSLPITKIIAVPGWRVEEKASDGIFLTMEKRIRKTIASLPENPQFSKIASDLARVYEESLDDEKPRRV